MDWSDWISWEGGLLSTAGPLILVAQAACVIHVIKTARALWWVWIVLMFPVIGLLAYVFLEVKPSFGRLDFRAVAWQLKSQRARIDARTHELAESTTIRNRLLLADELHVDGQYDRECQVLSEGLIGPFKDDAQLRMRLAAAHLEAGRTTDAAQLLATTTPERFSDAQFQQALLTARVSARQNEPARAAAQFQELISQRKSEGPRFYYAEFLAGQGKPDEAVVILKDILRQYRRGTRVWRHVERRWVQAARRSLKSVRTRTAFKP